MIRKKYIAVTLILSLLSINKVSAHCTQEEKDGFKKAEEEYKVTYEFNKESKDYTIYFKSTEPDKYYYQIYTDDKLQCNTIDEETVKCIHFKPDHYSIDIVGVTSTCNDVLKEFTIKLSYNKYWEDPLCEGNEEFYLCNPSYDKEVDRETFESRLNTYKKTQQQKNEEKKNVEETEETKIIKLIKDNWVPIIIVLIFIILVIITAIITIKQSRKSRRLE